MAYTSLGFWILLAAVLTGVALLRPRFRVPWLIAASLWFYASDEPVRLVWLGGVVAVALVAASVPGRAVRGAAVIGLVALLACAKFPEALGLPDPQPPPGLSFFVFTAIAVIVESGRRSVSWTLPEAILHLAWFPKLLAGPIERPQALIPQFPSISLRPGLAGLGLAFLVSGLVKKLVIADNLAPIVDAAYAIPGFATPVDLIVATYFFAFQIYCDFSGYTDIAVGLSALVGLRLSRNFAHPYLSVTVGEFWSSRWHITLGHWFRDYVYIPLGGSRHGRGRQSANLMAVFLFSGLWHAGLGYGVGWGFLIWGALNGALVLGELWLPVPERRSMRVLRAVLTFHLIMLTWVFFRAASASDAVTILARIFGGLTDALQVLPSYPFTGDQILGAALILVLLAADLASEPRSLAERVAEARLPLRWACLYAGMLALLLIGRWQDTSFIYAGF